jgi:hypothetical protein
MAYILDQESFENAMRKSIEPSLLHAAQDNDTPYTTPVLLTGVPTLVVIPLVLKDSQDFTLVVDEFVFTAVGVTNRHFLSAYGTSMTTNIGNTLVITELLVNGTPVQGSSIERKVGSGSDVGSAAQSTYFTMDHGDVLGFRVTVSNDTTVTFSRTSANVTEV